MNPICYTTRLSVQISMFQKTCPWNMGVSSSRTTSWRCVDSRSYHSSKKKSVPPKQKKIKHQNMPSWDFCSSPNRHLHGQIGEFLVLRGQPFPIYRTLGESNDGMRVQGDHLPGFLFWKCQKAGDFTSIFILFENGLPMSNLSNVILITSDIRGPPCFPPSLSTCILIILHSLESLSFLKSQKDPRGKHLSLPCLLHGCKG